MRAREASSSEAQKFGDMATMKLVDSARLDNVVKLLLLAAGNRDLA